MATELGYGSLQHLDRLRRADVAANRQKRRRWIEKRNDHDGFLVILKRL
jgi:hypothetical protein